MTTRMVDSKPTHDDMESSVSARVPEGSRAFHDRRVTRRYVGDEDAAARADWLAPARAPTSAPRGALPPAPGRCHHRRVVAAPPEDLDAHVLRGGDEELVVLSFTPTGRSALTDAELRVAIGLAAGRSNAEIAGRLGVSVRTVANHVASVLRKLGASSRNQVAARFGIEQLV